VREFIDAGLAAGIHGIFKGTRADALAAGMTLLPHVDVFATKRLEPGQSTPRLKFRLAPDGGKEPDSTFAPGSIASGSVDIDTLLYTVAHGAALGLACSKSDVSGAFPSHNWLTDPLCVNKRRVGTVINSLLSGTGKEEVLEFFTLTNGLKDASRLWELIFARVLLREGFVRSIGCRNQWYKHLAPDGFMSLSVIVDDTLKFRTRNAAGTKIHDDLVAALNAEGFKSRDAELDDSPEGIDFAGMTLQRVENQYGSGIGVTLPSMAKAIADLLAESGHAVPTATDIAWLPMAKGWTPLAAAQSSRTLFAGAPS